MAERLLLDTHAIIWWFCEPSKLSAAAYAAIENGENTIYASAISAMEIATKFRIGKLDIAQSLADNFLLEIEKDGFIALPLTVAQGQLGGNLAIHNKDPFDRLLIAQAQVEQLKLVSIEQQFDDYGVIRLW